MFNNPNYIETKQHFDTYYNDNILPILHNIEKTRKIYLSVFLCVCILVTLWVAQIIFTLNSKEASQISDILRDYGVVICFAILLLFSPMFFYRKKSKQSLLPLIANFFGEFSYTDNQQISTSIINNSIIIPEYDKLYTDDNFYGFYKDVPVDIMEYKIMDKHIRIINQQRREVITKKGQGIIFYAKMNKNFNGKTIVTKDKGLLNILTHFNGLQKVGLESIEFEKAYEIYSDNQIEARYILTASMIQHMLELKNNFPKIEYSFFDKYVFINIKTKHNLFECSSFFTSIINSKRIEKNFRELYLLFSIIDVLKLSSQR